MINLSTETIFPVSDAPKHIPGRPSKASCWRWVLQGVGGIKLESILIGGKRYTSHEAVQRFGDRRTAAIDGDTLPTQTNTQRERAIRQAEADCERSGI